MAKFNISVDRIIGLSAILISLSTLVIFIYQTNLMREQSRLSVTPRIAFSRLQTANDSLVNVVIQIENKGLGPAIIESINIAHKGKKHPLNFNEFIKNEYPIFTKYAKIPQTSTLSKGSTLSPDEFTNIYTIEFPLENLEGLLTYLNISINDTPFIIEVVYSSIYGEKWKTSNVINGHPVAL